MKKFFAVFVVLFSLSAPMAFAFETPLLTWERGRTQQVVLGGGEETSNWQVQLEGNEIEPIRFEKSSKNRAGYVVYSVNVPNDIPTGAYTVVAVGEGSPRTPVAVIAMVQASTKTAASSLFDLSRIIALFAFLTTLLGTLRLKKYSQLNAYSSQAPSEEASNSPKSILQKIQSSPERIRVGLLTDLKPSVLRYLLLQEGELLYRRARTAYSFLPIIGLILGTIVSFELMRNDGLAKTGLGIFIAVTLLSIVDPVAGIAAVAAFSTSELVAGNVFSVRDLLLVITISFTWIAPALFAALIRQVIPLDLSNLIKSRTLVDLISAITAAAVGSLTFYFGYQLVNSIIYTENSFQKITEIQLGVIFVALFIRSIIGAKLLKSNSDDDAINSNFHLARVNSPITAIGVNLIIFAFVYIWTQSAEKSLLVSALFAIPYYLVFIGFGSERFGFLSRIPRNFIIEALAVAGICWLIFQRISDRPLLQDEASFWLLVFTSIPLIVHAQVTAIWPNQSQKETISS